MSRTVTGPIQMADSQFQTTVFPDELEVIWRRRESAQKLSSSMTGWPPPRRDDPAPSAQHDLMGLALSGGGIRSASFALGVLQKLSASGLLSRVDYLSTVSGGGLIGSSVSCLLNSPGVSAESGPAAAACDDRFPLGFNCGEVERPAIRHLRSRSRWLAPEGGLDNIRLPAIILRGILDNFAVLLPLMMIAVLVTEQLFGIAYRVGLDRLHYAPLIGAAVFAVIALAQPVLYRLFSGRYLYSWPARNRYEQILSIALVLEIVVLVLVPTFLLVQQAIDLDWNGVKAWYGEYGQLVYLKSSMTGDEPDTIRQYREVHPTFPQESSSNQAFTEPQFEAYRALGEHIITTVIAETAKGVSGGVHVDWPVDLRA